MVIEWPNFSQKEAQNGATIRKVFYSGSFRIPGEWDIIERGNGNWNIWKEVVAMIVTLILKAVLRYSAKNFI